MSQPTLSEWKKGTYTPKQDKLQKIADYFGVTLDYLMGNTHADEQTPPETQKAPTLNKKDERDIKKKLDEMLELFDSADALMFDGEPLDEETRQLLRDSYENQLRLTKQLAKAKFTPKKYREK